THDGRLLKEAGGGSIHFCGNGQHLVEPMMQIKDLKGFDIGQPEMMNALNLYEQTRKNGLALMPLRPAREDLVSGRARREFQTGVVFSYLTADFDDAKQVAESYSAA
ncbi:MAG: hypothetical protein M1608_10935, partial [Candidatus Omnitrophica bacterium]|nr:hypothetical protein [Candidatus Omnitrophota bacterium]